MASSTREEIVEVFNALDADMDRLCALSFDVFTTPELMRALERLETVERRLRTPQHALINHLAAQAAEEELGGKLPAALADRLRITKAEAAPAHRRSRRPRRSAARSPGNRWRRH